MARMKIPVVAETILFEVKIVASPGGLGAWNPSFKILKLMQRLPAELLIYLFNIVVFVIRKIPVY